MSSAVKSVMLRVIGKRLKEGDTFENIIKSYPKLTKSDIAEIRKAFDITE